MALDDCSESRYVSPALWPVVLNVVHACAVPLMTNRATMDVGTELLISVLNSVWMIGCTSTELLSYEIVGLSRLVAFSQLPPNMPMPGISQLLPPLGWLIPGSISGPKLGRLKPGSTKA